MVSAESYFQQAELYLRKTLDTQMDSIKRAADMLANQIQLGGVVHIFGSGHSRAFSMEMSNRAGGLVPMHAMSFDDLLRHGVKDADDINNPEIERDPRVAHELLNLYDIRDNDAAILVSNSGRNGALIEMALLLKQRGLPLVVVTSMDHTTKVTARHPSGKRLFELADHLIDNGGPLGDAILDDESLITKVCSISSVTGAVIAQCLTAEITKNLLQKGIDVPILISANVDGADEHNAKIRSLYTGRI